MQKNICNLNHTISDHAMRENTNTFFFLCCNREFYFLLLFHPFEWQTYIHIWNFFYFKIHFPYFCSANLHKVHLNTASYQIHIVSSMTSTCIPGAMVEYNSPKHILSNSVLTLRIFPCFVSLLGTRRDKVFQCLVNSVWHKSSQW